MRVGLVRNVGLSAVALLALGLAGCDDNPLEFEDGAAVLITTNPSTMTVPAGITTLLESRTVDEGNRPTWDDVTAAVDATCGTGTLTVVVAADNEPEVIPPGRFDVTAGTTLGASCIVLTGAGLTATVDVNIIGASLSLVGPAEVIFETTGQIVATLLGANDEVVGPFDQTTDLVWSSDLPAIASVDGSGLVTANSVGDAVITATWTDPGSGAQVSADHDIKVPTLPIPVISAVSPLSGDLGQVITITGVDFFSVTNVFIDGAEAVFVATVVSPTEMTFLIPISIGLGAHQISVGTTGGFDMSNELTYTALAGFTNGANEPANDDVVTATPITSLPFVTNDGFVGAEQFDWFSITLTEPRTLEILLEWDDLATDVDVYVHDTTGDSFECFDGGTLANPETSTCSLDAGDWTIQIWTFGPNDTVYSLLIE